MNRRRMFSMNETDLGIARRTRACAEDAHVGLLPGTALVTPPPFSPLSTANSRMRNSRARFLNTHSHTWAITHTLSLTTHSFITHALFEASQRFREVRRGRRVVGHQVYTTIREWVTLRHERQENNKE